jgi:hypothetical protein
MRDYIVAFVILVGVGVTMGCAGAEKPVDTFRELICPPTYLEELKICETSADRLGAELMRARADSNAYKVAHKRCMDRFNIGLSKSR